MASLAIRGGGPVRTRPFPAWPVQTEEQVEAVCRVVQSGRWSRHSRREPQQARPTGDAAAPWEADLFEAELADEIGVEHALAVSSGTVALDLIVRALEVGPGEEIIVPAYAPIGAATCALESNALPVFVDVDPHTYMISRATILEALTPRTRAVVFYHIGGAIGPMEEITQLTEARGLALVEDSRQGLGSRQPDGRAAGSFGDASAFSFGTSSVLSAGEGGLVATARDDIIERVRILHDHGLGLTFPSARVEAFGTSARMTEMQAALLRSQLRRHRGISERRQANVAYFQETIDLIGGLEMTAPVVEGGLLTYQYLVLRYDAEGFGGARRDQFLEAMRAEGIPCSVGFPEPLYASPLFTHARFLSDGCPVSCARVGRKVDFARYKRHCPNAERAAREEAVWLPQRLFLGDHSDVDDVLYAINKIRGHIDELTAEDEE